jgi:hypothetical protein
MQFCKLSLLAFTFCLLTHPVLATPIPTSSINNTSVFPVGLSIGKRNINPSVLVRGQEDGTQAVDFVNWLVPYDAVIQALKFNVTSLPDGVLELRSPSVVTRIDPKKLRSDPELGLVFSIQDLQTLFGVKAEFDIKEYAIVLQVSSNPDSKFVESEVPIQLENLPRFTPGKFSFAAVEQKINASGTQNISPSYRGDLIAVGTAFGGSWFIRTDQPNLQSQQTWNIAEAQFLQQSNQADYIVGSQSTFWQQGTGDYWGLTFIYRQGFVPPQSFGSFADTRQRMQAAQIKRTISGRAEPGTLVRLVQSLGGIIAEVLVDSSGVYRFENIKSDNNFGSNYRVLLYPQGRLTAQPEIREASYSTVPGQIPKGTSALVISGGLRRELVNESLIGNFSDFRGGVQRRWGVSESLTVGLGGIYDQSAKAMAELFYRPGIPLQVAVSTLTGEKWLWNADIRYDPSPNFSAAFTSDRLARRFYLDWRVFSYLGLFASTDNLNGTTGGVQINLSGRDAFTFARVSIDSENRLRWNLLQRLGKLELSQRGNEIGTLSEFTYNLSKNSLFNAGTSFLFNYETRAANSDNLLTLGWRYRSQKRSIDGNYLWEIQLGYGIGSQGVGPIATLSTTILPGILLRGRYQGVSVTADEGSFSVDLVSSLGLQRGFTPGDRRSDYFRTQGGLLIQPFLDINSNSQRDAGEEYYTNNPESLLVINNRSIKYLQPEINSDRVSVRLPPNTYRLDLDPAGFPPDWQAKSDAYAVTVNAGAYTIISIPLTRSYTVSGIVTDAQGKPINGARVEAVSSSGRLFSVTNGAGVYYLERLQQGTYTFMINGHATNSSLKLDNSSQAFQELNFKHQ